MRKFSRAIATVLCLFMIGGCFAGCSSSKVDKTKVSDPNVKAELDKGAKLSVLSPNHIDGAENDLYDAASKRFKEDYGVDVQIIQSTWDDWVAKYSATISAGDPADVVLCSVDDCLRFTMEGKLLPITDYIDINNHGFYPDVIKSSSTYKGQVYMACGRPNAWGIFYNKDKFEQKGIEDPAEQYKKGTWTFENFDKYCRQLNDEANQCYAICGYYVYPWLDANNTSLVKQNEDGTFSSNIQSEPVKEVLDLIQKMRFDGKYYNLEGDNPVQSFMAGHNAMFTDFTWVYNDILKYKKDNGDTVDVGFVPPPYGTNNVNEKKVPVHAGGHVISNGSDCPYLAGKYIEYLMDEENKQTDFAAQAEARGYVIDQTVLDGILDAGTRPACAPVTDSLVNNGSELFDSAGNGENVTTVVDTYAEVYQQTIEEKTKGASVK